MQFPVKRRPPLFAIDRFPTFGKPPTKVLIATIVNELEKVADTDRGFVDCEVLEENLMRGFLVVECKLVGTRTQPFVANLEQSTFDPRHAHDLRRRFWQLFQWCVELITQQVLDVVNKQLLVLHLVLETQSHQRQNCLQIAQAVWQLQNGKHLLVDVSAVSDGFFYGWT